MNVLGGEPRHPWKERVGEITAAALQVFEYQMERNDEAARSARP